MRLIAVSDIHGEAEKLNLLLGKLCLKKSDTLVFLGDYIDRGLQSKEVIETLITLSKNTNSVFLKGNHEQMLLDIFATKSQEKIANWLVEGGEQTFENYGDFPTNIKSHREFFQDLKPYFITEKYLFVHAGINPKKPLSEQTEDDLLWIREEFIYQKVENIKQKVIFGHTPFKMPLILPDKIGIDTACGKLPDAPLTAVICGDKEQFVFSN